MKLNFQELPVEETPDALNATSPGGKMRHWNRGVETASDYPNLAPELEPERWREAL